jgi:hypothetical protein
LGGRVGVDDDPFGLGVAPAAGGAGDRLEGHCESERFGERAQRRDQVRVGVAGERLAGRLQRCLLDAVDRRDLLPVEHEHGLERHPGFAGLLAADAVAFLDGQRYWRSGDKRARRMRRCWAVWLVGPGATKKDPRRPGCSSLRS